MRRIDCTIIFFIFVLLFSSCTKVDEETASLLPTEDNYDSQSDLNLVKTKLATISSSYRVDNSDVHFSPNGKMVVYVAGDGKKSFVVFGNKTSKAYDNMIVFNLRDIFIY